MDKEVKTLVLVVAALVIVPIVVGAVAQVVVIGATGVCNVINSIKYDRMIKKGLKDGSIIYYEGDYVRIYECEPEEEA